MSSPHDTNDPFPAAGDETLCEKEALALENRFTPQSRSFESMATQPPENYCSQDASTSEKEIMRATQAILQSACKRRKLSSSGTKPTVAKRLSEAGVSSRDDVLRLADEFKNDGPDGTLAQNGKSKSPNWTKNEVARLCHVIADPRHATVVGRLYNKFDSRAELDAGKHDPWSAEFVDLFNSDDYEPLIPEGCNGVTDDLLLGFDPCVHPHKRSGTFLKQRWNKLRSKYTVARENFTRSGQGEDDTFDNCTDGDDSIAYMHCVFYGLPSLEAIVRALPDTASVEVGIKEVEKARETLNRIHQTKAKKRNADTALAEGLSSIAKSLSEPINITFNDNKEDTTAAATLMKFDVSDRIAATVEKHMNLESTIISRLEAAKDSENHEYISSLEKRLVHVRDRIEKSFLTE